GDINLLELDTQQGKKFIHIDMPEAEPVNAIRMELETLARSIIDDQPTKVSIEDGYRALKVADEIVQLIGVGTAV
ncbi:MAG: gfo/Idh/MocA family oxidoreductase, partial [Bacteroidota bacterium]